MVTKKGQPVTDIIDIKTFFHGIPPYRSIIWNLIEREHSLVFKSFDSEVFTYNLRMIDTDAPELLAALMIERYRFNTPNPKLFDVIERVSHEGVALRYLALHHCGDTEGDRRIALTLKMKRILSAFTLGAVPDQRWDGLERLPGSREIKTVAPNMFTNREVFADDLFKRARFAYAAATGDQNQAVNPSQRGSSVFVNDEGT